MMTAESQQDRARTAREMMRLCCRKALVRLNSSEPDLRTVANQLAQTGALALKQLEQEPRK